jgi:dihydroceramide fatty acyl 2-hydroxylase
MKAEIAGDEAAGRAKYHKGSARMFRSNFFEWFSHVHPALPAVLFLPVVVVSLYFALGPRGIAPPVVAGWFFGGYLIWTLFEYWFHRLFFHLPVRGPRSEKVYFYVHGVHHDWPWDRSRLVMPPTVSIGLALIMFFVFRAVWGPGAMLAPFAGFVLGYVIYDSVHWYVHAGKPRGWVGKHLRREHLVHHFKESNTRFGVSCPWWDHVFRTTGAADEIPSGAAQEVAR